MRFITADILFPISSPPVKNGILVIEEDGSILELIDPSKNQTISKYTINPEKVESFTGFICPGFVNAHCHLELSHLKGKFTTKSSLPGFLTQLKLQRQAPAGEIAEFMELADAEMVANGIVAVGDISNSDHSFDVKKKSRIRYHTFVEVYDLHPDRADEIFNRGKDLLEQARNAGFSASLVPHAPYTVSQKLLKQIGDLAMDPEEILCIHNQETETEDKMFLEGKGSLFSFLMEASSLYENWAAPGDRSLPSVFSHLPRKNKMGFIHNTYTSAEDIAWAQLYSNSTWWCLCPNANMFIENRLPDIPLFMQLACKLMIGTDSYASNWSLSILEELKRIHTVYPKISLATLLEWSTLGGATFLGMNDTLGSFEKGKKPGINLLTYVNKEEQQLTAETQVFPLI